LTMAVNPSGGGTTSPAVGAHPGYAANQVVNITATPATGYHFVNWTGDVANLNNTSTTVIMNANKTVTANFEFTDVNEGPEEVDLGTSGDGFVILSEAGITDIPLSVITGNIGTWEMAGSAIGVTCAEVSGTIYDRDAAYTGGGGGSTVCRLTDDPLLNAAVLDMRAAYTAAANATPGVGPFLNLGGGTVAGQTLVPGVYTWGSDVTITSDLILSGGANDVWIFQITGTLDISSNMKVLLSGGAQAKNIFWQVADVVTLGTGSHFEGIILAKTKIAMQTDASINGRLWAQTEVTLDQNTVTQPQP
ncbi:MAG TPA: ice-binding family protein, partial [Atribacterota bacterium]|nr:ice-binding family protein [Atribacterota bacterium]